MCVCFCATSQTPGRGEGVRGGRPGGGVPFIEVIFVQVQSSQLFLFYYFDVQLRHGLIQEFKSGVNLTLGRRGPREN